MALATASTASCLRLLTMTLAPNSARPRAIDSPIPLLAPVTMATLPVRLKRARIESDIVIPSCARSAVGIA